MTPAIQLAKRQKIDYRLHEYTHTPKAMSYGLEAAEKLGIDAAQVFKTLVVCDEKGELAVAVLPVNCSLNVKKMAKAIGVKKIQLAEPKVVERTTGYVLGGVSPLGQKKRLTTLIDSRAQTHSTIFVSAGKRGLEIELSPAQLLHAVAGTFEDLVNDDNVTDKRTH